MNILRKLLGNPQDKLLKKLSPILEKVDTFEKKYLEQKDLNLPALTQTFKDRLEQGESLDDLLPEAFAATRIAGQRTLHMRHFPVQLIGGITIHRGEIAEMRTGEGKTLVATLPVYLNALTGKGVHVITVNDYLAKRDAVWMGQIYNALGMSVGIVTGEGSFKYREVPQEELDQIRDSEGSYNIEEAYLQRCTKKEAYACDITYGTNNEFGFDYLRDNMAQRQDQQVQRGHHFCIVDEIDSVLIDEARTPLIISAPDATSPQLYGVFASITPKLIPDTDYTVDEKMRSVHITESGIDKVEKSLGITNLYEEKGIAFVHHLEQALKAQSLFKKDRDYVVKDGEVVIVDQFTGRMMPGRRYSEGLHQAIEAKEGVKIQQESKTLATITFQNYFRLYEKLSGMTGTAETSAEEFYKVYHLGVTTIPTNKPIARKDQDDLIFKSEKTKFEFIAEEIKSRQSKGQPVLVGTVSIEKSELLASLLKKRGIKCNVLNAKQHESEGHIIADAGRKGAVTIATNMAGRGVDIKLGGANATPEEKQEIMDLGGLYVIGTERHEARRIDNQLRGRAGRQGEPGETQFFLSVEDDVMRIFGGDKIKDLMNRMNFPEDVPLKNGLLTKIIENSQSKIEGFHFDSRKNLLEYDDVMNKQREIIYKKRNDILSANTPITENIDELVKEQVGRSVAFHTNIDNIKDWDVDEILTDVRGLTNLEKITVEKEIRDIVAGQESLEVKKSSITKLLTEFIHNTFTTKLEGLPEDQVKQLLRGIYLQTIDMLWMDHLEVMDYLKTGIKLRGYAQRDPLVEYKNEAFNLFEKLLLSINENYISTLLRVQFTLRQPIPENTIPEGITNKPSDTVEASSSKPEKIHEHQSDTSTSKPKKKRMSKKERRRMKDKR